MVFKHIGRTRIFINIFGMFMPLINSIFWLTYYGHLYLYLYLHLIILPVYPVVSLQKSIARLKIWSDNNNSFNGIVQPVAELFLMTQTATSVLL